MTDSCLQIKYFEKLAFAIFARQIFAIPGNAQAKIEDVSRVLLNHVSQMPGKSIIQQVTTGTGQPFADIGKKLAVGYLVYYQFIHSFYNYNYNNYS